MPEDQRRFREAYRAQVPGWYNGYAHVGVVLSTTLIALWVFAQFIHEPVWWEWLVVPAAAVTHGVVEWILHRYIMHRPSSNKAFHAVYSGHALNHHRFFTNHEMRVRDQRDWRAVFFPPYAIVLFIFMAMPFVAVLQTFTTQNIAWLFIFTTVTMHIMYETMHFLQHLDDNWFLRWCPVINTMRRHHLTHHVVEMMHKKNLSVLFPTVDWAFGTSDLDRGLFGHFFNGYSKKHLKKGMPALPGFDETAPLVEPYSRRKNSAGVSLKPQGSLPQAAK